MMPRAEWRARRRPIGIDRQVVEEGIGDVVECRIVRPREQALERQRLVAKIEEALSRSDLRMVDEITALPAMHGFPLPPALAEGRSELKTRLEQARLSRRSALLNALVQNDRSVFFDVFDRSLVNELSKQFPHHVQTINRWIETEILPASRCGWATSASRGSTWMAGGSSCGATRWS